MTLKNKAIEITEFQTHLLQDFFALAINTHRHFASNDWRQEFENCVLNAPSKFSKNYTKAKQLLSQKNLDEIEVSDMDVSLIMTLLLHTTQFERVVNNDEVRACLAGFVLTRNSNAHRNAQESELDYYRWISGVLYHAEQFLELAPIKLNWLQNSTDGNEFIRRYLKEARRLIEMIDAELQEWVIGDRYQYAVEMDVKYLKSISSPADRLEKYWDIQRKYSDQCRLDCTDQSHNAYRLFLHECAKENIEEACLHLFHDYYSGGFKKDGTRFCEPDYSLSAKYLLKEIKSTSRLSTFQCCKLLEFIDYGEIPDPNGYWRKKAEEELAKRHYHCVKKKYPNTDRLYYDDVDDKYLDFVPPEMPRK